MGKSGEHIAEYTFLKCVGPKYKPVREVPLYNMELLIPFKTIGRYCAQYFGSQRQILVSARFKRRMAFSLVLVDPFSYGVVDWRLILWVAR